MPLFAHKTARSVVAFVRRKRILGLVP